MEQSISNFSGITHAIYTTVVKFTANRRISIPLHAGATGKILLVHCPPEIRSRVFASSREEWMPHAGDISVPVFDQRKEFVAQMGIAGIAEKVFRDFEKNLRLLREVAHTLEAML